MKRETVTYELDRIIRTIESERMPIQVKEVYVFGWPTPRKLVQVECEYQPTVGSEGDSDEAVYAGASAVSERPAACRERLRGLLRYCYRDAA